MARITFADVTSLEPLEFWEEEVLRGGFTFRSNTATDICQEITEWDYWHCVELDELGTQRWMDLCVPALVEIGAPRE